MIMINNDRIIAYNDLMAMVHIQNSILSRFFQKIRGPYFGNYLRMFSSNFALDNSCTYDSNNNNYERLARNVSIKFSIIDYEYQHTTSIMTYDINYNLKHRLQHTASIMTYGLRLTTTFL
ncbi:hypothetical protein Glove_196g26 [Diversispora epigaea]|uniref:Uncharacterized protein n=1 Tax=Diversispora epigaea TaxID=1348612 RepID=A0A397IUH2_9GLOM|nr:hypothetical protein Glove_196g26 [Diversispora epigaea]